MDLRFASLLVLIAAQLGTPDARDPISSSGHGPSIGRSEPTAGTSEYDYLVATPRGYQRAFANDVFAAMVYLDRLVAAEPSSVAARRALMIRRIRTAMLATHASIDTAQLDRVLAVMAELPREAFIPADRARYAYVPFPVPIGHDQTISDPYIVALMTMAANVGPDDAVLDVGTGSGYQAAVVARMASSVTSIEIVKPLARSADRRLRSMGFRNIHVMAGNGFRGVLGSAPYDVILVAAGASAVPGALLAQLRPGGRLVMPIGPAFSKEVLTVVRKSLKGDLTSCALGQVGFVPMTGTGVAETATGEAPTTFCYGALVT